MKSGTHTFHAPQTELIFLDCQKMQNALRNIIREMDFSACKTLETEMNFSDHRTLQLEWVEMDFSMAVPRISVERMKATEVVITATVMMSQMSIAICPMTILVEVSLLVKFRDHILLTRGIQSFSYTVVIISCASHLHRDHTLSTADVSAPRITLPVAMTRKSTQRLPLPSLTTSRVTRSQGESFDRIDAGINYHQWGPIDICRSYDRPTTSILKKAKQLHVRPVGSKWVFKTRRNPDGSTRYKAHLVIKGYEQTMR